MKIKMFLEHVDFDEIEKFYKREYTKTLKLGGFKITDNESSKGKFEAIPAGTFIVEVFEEFLKGKKFLDVGCGYGNVVRLAHKFDMISSGIEIDRKYKLYHNDIKVQYKNAKTFNYSDYDTIFLYRPMHKDKDMYDIIYQIINTAKPKTRIIYVNYGLATPYKNKKVDGGYRDIRKYNWVQELVYDTKKIEVIKQGVYYWNYKNIDFIDNCIVFDINE